MNVLFDQGTPAPLRSHLPDHDVATAFERGWSMLKNGDLLREAEADGFDVLVTTDQNLKHQQNLVGRRIATVVLTLYIVAEGSDSPDRNPGCYR